MRRQRDVRETSRTRGASLVEENPRRTAFRVPRDGTGRGRAATERAPPARPRRRHGTPRNQSPPPPRVSRRLVVARARDPDRARREGSVETPRPSRCAEPRSDARRETRGVAATAHRAGGGTERGAGTHHVGERELRSSLRVSKRARVSGRDALYASRKREGFSDLNGGTRFGRLGD